MNKFIIGILAALAVSCGNDANKKNAANHKHKDYLNSLTVNQQYCIYQAVDSYIGPSAKTKKGLIYLGVFIGMNCEINKDHAVFVYDELVRLKVRQS